MLELLALDPGNVRLASDAASAAIDAQAWNEARGVLEDTLQHHPGSPNLLAQLGFVLMCEQNFSRARATLEKARMAGSELPVVPFNLAYCHFMLGDIDAALETLGSLNGEAISRDPLLLKCRCYHHKGNLSEAANLLQEHLDKNSDDAEAAGLLSLILLDDGKFEEAVKHSSDLIENGSRSYEASLAFAGASFSLGDYAAAATEYQLATEEFPESGRAWSGKAQTEFRDLRFADALRASNKAVRLMPDHIGTWHVKAWTHLLLDEFDEALQAFSASLEIDRNFGESYGGLASVYALQGNTELAEHNLKLARRLSPLGLSQTFAEAVLLNRSGKAKEANTVLETLMQTEHSELGVVPGEIIAKRLAELTASSDSANESNHESGDK